MSSLLFEISVDKLSAITSSMAGVVPNRPVLPILNSIHLSSNDDGSVTFAATNLSQQLQVTLPLDVSKPFEMCLGFRHLHRFAQTMAKQNPDQVLQVKESGPGSVRVRGEKNLSGKAPIVTIGRQDAAEYPRLSEVGAHLMTFSAGAFLRRLRDVEKQAGDGAMGGREEAAFKNVSIRVMVPPPIYTETEEIDPREMNGEEYRDVLRLVMIGTDGKSLTHDSQPYRRVLEKEGEGLSSMEEGILLPSGTGAQLHKIFSDDKPIELYQGGKGIAFRQGHVEFWTDMPPRAFPNVYKAMNKPTHAPMTVDRKALLSRLDLAGLYSTPVDGGYRGTPKVLLSLDVENARMVLKASTEGAETSYEDAIPVEIGDGTPVSVSILASCEFLSSVLKTTPGDKVTIHPLRFGTRDENPLSGAVYVFGDEYGAERITLLALMTY